MFRSGMVHFPFLGVCFLNKYLKSPLFISSVLGHLNTNIYCFQLRIGEWVSCLFFVFLARSRSSSCKQLVALPEKTALFWQLKFSTWIRIDS